MEKKKKTSAWIMNWEDFNVFNVCHSAVVRANQILCGEERNSNLCASRNFVVSSPTFISVAMLSSVIMSHGKHLETNFVYHRLFLFPYHLVPIIAVFLGKQTLIYRRVLSNI